MDDYTEIIEKLKIRKKAMNLTYAKLEEVTGYSASAIVQLFMGRNCGLMLFFDVCKTLGIEVRVV